MKNPWIWLVALIIAPILIFLRDGEFLGVTAATFTAENPMTVQSAEGPPAGIVLAQNNPSAGQPTAKQKKTPAPRSAPTSANRSNTTSQDQKLKAWGIAALAAFLLIFVLGMTNRVVVFQDGTDFTWSLMTLIAPDIASEIAPPETASAIDAIPVSADREEPH